MKIIQDEGIVLRKRQLKEKDELVTVLTKNHGKMMFVVPGSRDPRSKKAGILELCNTIGFQVRESKSRFPYLNQVKLLKSRGFHIVEEDSTLDEFYRALGMLKLTDQFVQEEHNVNEVYALLSQGLDGVILNVSEMWYWIHLLDFLGFLPDFKICVGCHEKPDSSFDLVFCAEHKGFAHRKCLSMNTETVQNTTVSISFDLLKIVSFIQLYSLSEVGRLSMDQKIFDQMKELFDTVKV
ncbi:MAG: DNA repair protein RecO [Candidatus Gracilibacteria bacterium]|nr:DNA repair protein RecO [Candidatus Gracilibacteria bacterium]